MRAMILAAGQGTRLYPLTFSLPKPLAPVVNRPVMEHIIRLLVSQRMNEIMINLHYMPEIISGYFTDGGELGASITYSHEERLLGTAGGVKKVREWFGHQTFLVIGGDDFCDMRIQEAVEFHKGRKALATIVLSPIEDPSQYGIVVTDPEGRITSFQEKPARDAALSLMANTGIYIFEPEIFSLIPDGKVYDFGRELFPLLLKKSLPFYGTPLPGYWCDVGSLKEYAQCHWDILEGKAKVQTPPIWVSTTSGESSSPTDARVWKEEGTVIHSSARLRGNVLIGKNVSIGKGVVIEGPAVIGDSCLIHEGAFLKQSILWESVTVGREASLIQCIAGKGYQVSSGAVREDACLAPASP